MSPIKIGISIGDINGIGLEVILKTLTHPIFLQKCIPVIYASNKVISYHKNIIKADLPLATAHPDAKLHPGKVYVKNCWTDNVNITLGKVTEEGGKYAYISLDSATRDLKAGYLDALVTAPIHKKAMSMAQFPYKGHTDFLAAQFEEDGLMLMVSEQVKVAVVTEHVPLRDVPELITKERVLHKLNKLINSLRVDFGINKPVVAVLGLNPHAGDEGVMGLEDEEIVKPAIIETKKSGELVMGPYPADGFFGSNQFLKVDAVLAMYHDQGLVPFKTLSFDTGVNFTAGLPIVRTSPGHGTAMAIAGKNEADATSFRNALFLAIDAFNNRKDYEETKRNALKRKAKPSEEEVS